MFPASWPIAIPCTLVTAKPVHPGAQWEAQNRLWRRSTREPASGVRAVRSMCRTPRSRRSWTYGSAPATGRFQCRPGTGSPSHPNGSAETFIPTHVCEAAVRPLNTPGDRVSRPRFGGYAACVFREFARILRIGTTPCVAQLPRYTTHSEPVHRSRPATYRMEDTPFQLLFDAFDTDLDQDLGNLAAVDQHPWGFPWKIHIPVRPALA